ncbi:unnamed protein product [Amoebophrya sp. A120]|nr:unnamed protein product [Amoebophrya sp. A120]|eukprot:GSA120T00005530001.1
MVCGSAFDGAVAARGAGRDQHLLRRERKFGGREDPRSQDVDPDGARDHPQRFSRGQVLRDEGHRRDVPEKRASGGREAGLSTRFRYEHLQAVSPCGEKKIGNGLRRRHGSGVSLPPGRHHKQAADRNQHGNGAFRNYGRSNQNVYSNQQVRSGSNQLRGLRGRRCRLQRDGPKGPAKPKNFRESDKVGEKRKAIRIPSRVPGRKKLHSPVPQIDRVRVADSQGIVPHSRKQAETRGVQTDTGLGNHQ